MQWGLAQTHCVTVPLRVTLFPMSYAAAPWCANSGSEKIETPIPRATHIKNLPFKNHLLFGGTRSSSSLGSVRPHLYKLDAVLKTSVGHSQVRLYLECISRIVRDDVKIITIFRRIVLVYLMFIPPLILTTCLRQRRDWQPPSYNSTSPMVSRSSLPYQNPAAANEGLTCPPPPKAWCTSWGRQSSQ